MLLLQVLPLSSSLPSTLLLLLLVWPSALASLLLLLLSLLLSLPLVWPSALASSLLTLSQSLSVPSPRLPVSPLHPLLSVSLQAIARVHTRPEPSFETIAWKCKTLITMCTSTDTQTH